MSPPQTQETVLKKSELNRTACGQCGAVFPSRRKLFLHLRTSGHAQDWFPTVLLQEAARGDPVAALGALDSTLDVDAMSDSGLTALTMAVRKLTGGQLEARQRPAWLKLVEALALKGAAADVMTQASALWGEGLAATTPVREAIKKGDLEVALATLGVRREIARGAAPFLDATSVELVARRVPLACGHSMTAAGIPTEERAKVALRCEVEDCARPLSVRDAAAVLRCPLLLAAAAQGDWRLCAAWVAAGRSPKAVTAGGSTALDKMGNHLRLGCSGCESRSFTDLLAVLLEVGVEHRRRTDTRFLAAAALSNYEALRLLLLLPHPPQVRAAAATDTCTVHLTGGVCEARVQLECGHAFCVDALELTASIELGRGAQPRCPRCCTRFGARDLARVASL